MRQDAIDDLLRGLRTGSCAVAPAVWAVDLTEQSEQGAEIVVNLCHRSDCRPRILARRLLLDRNRRRQPDNTIDLRFRHLAQELSGVCGE